MFVRLTERELEKLAERFAELFINAVKINCKARMLNGLKEKAKMNDGKLFYFDLEDDYEFILTYELNTTWNTLKIHINNPRAFKTEVK